MSPQKDRLMPAWLPSAHFGRGYSAIKDGTTDDAFEMHDFTTSSALMSGNHVTADTSYAPVPINKTLPNPPSRIQSLRRRITSIHWQPVGHIFQRNEGYHFGVLCATVVVASVFLVNVVLTIWAASRYGVKGGLGTIHDGACSKTKNLAAWLHLAINALSTLLLGASNYAMQCLAAPTRGEVDKAHRRSLWMDIGVPSMRNLWRISRSRLVMWWLVATSSVPLHLMYNSAVFSTLSARDYSVFTVTNDFLTGAPYNVSQAMVMPARMYESPPIPSYRVGYTPYALAIAAAQNMRGNFTRLQRLENKPCIEEYSKEIISTRSSVLLVSSYENDTNAVLDFWPSQSPRFDRSGLYSPPWPCDYPDNSLQDKRKSCDIGKKAAEASTWHMNGRPILYCLSQPVEEHCRLQFSVGIMAIVICCNLVKMIVMGYIAWTQPLNLVTVGDAIASFLDKPDPTTGGKCLAGKADFRRSKIWDRTAMRWEPVTRYWFHAASKKRWLTCNILCMITLICSGFLLRVGLRNTALQSTSISHLWSLGFGTVTAESLANLYLGSDKIILTIVIANSPQLVLSFLYLTYNGLFTCMLLADEWNDYAHTRKALRVTQPAGDQRSTYRLQLPYKYGIPLIVMSGLLHWLVSQSFFLARVSVYDDSGYEDTGESVSTCGYSCIAIIFTIILGFLVVMLGLANGFRKLKPGMPLAGSCSAAISAACHPPEADVYPSTNAVMWGVVGYETAKEGAQAVGHCSLTSVEVQAPVPGQLYARAKWEK